MAKVESELKFQHSFADHNSCNGIQCDPFEMHKRRYDICHDSHF